VNELDTPAEDLITDLSADELVAYVATSNNDGGPAVTHLFYATRKDRSQQFGSLLTLVTPGAYNDFSAAVSKDGLTAVVASDRDGGADLFVLTRGSTFSAFAGTGTPAIGLNSPQDEGTPRWTADNQTLYFDSARTGNRDIFRAPTQGGTFGAAEAVAELNTTALEAAPVLTADELTIYFLSTRLPSTDGDVWTASRHDKTSAFGTPTRVLSLSSPGVDAPGWLSPDGCTIYISSTRGKGDFDIYFARKPP
jgi:Tol biopolymer transport system component